MLERKGRRFGGWHPLEMFAIPSHEWYMFFQAVQDVWCEYKSTCALGIPISIVFSYMTNKIQKETGLKLELAKRAAEVESGATSLGAFLRRARYGPIDRLVYARKVSRFSGRGGLQHVLLVPIMLRYGLGILRLICNMAVDVMLAFFAVGWLTEFGWSALEDQKWFLCNYVEGKILLLQSEPLLVCRSAIGAKMREGDHVEAISRSREKFANCEMSTKYA